MSQSIVGRPRVLSADQRKWLKAVAPILGVDIPGAEATSNQDLPQTGGKVHESSLREAAKTPKPAPKVAPAAPVVHTDHEKYDKMLPMVEQYIVEVKKHRQAKVVAALIAKAEEYVAKAKVQASKSLYADAFKLLQDATVEYAKASGLAEKTATRVETELSLREDFNNLKLHQGVDRIGAVEIKKLDDKFKQLGPLIVAQKWDDFDNRAADISVDIAYWKGIANGYAEYIGLRNNALKRVGELEAHPKKVAIKTEIAAMKKLIDDGNKAYDTTKDFRTARVILLKVEPKYVEAKKKADGGSRGDFQKQLAAANLNVKGLDKPEKKNPIVDGEMAAIKAKLATAVKYAAAKQYPEAMKMLDAVVKDIERVEKLATQQVAFGAAQSGAKGAIANIVKDSKKAVEAVQKFHHQVKAHPQAAAIQPQLTDVQKTIDQAKAALA